MALTPGADRWSHRSDLRRIVRQTIWAARQVVVRAPGTTLAIAGVDVLLALSPAATIRITQHLVNMGVSVAGSLAHAGPPTGILVRFFPWLAALAMSLVATGAVMWRVKSTFEQRQKQQLQYTLDRLRLEKTSRLPLLFFELTETYDVIGRAEGVAQKVGSLFRDALDAATYLVQLLTVVVLYAAVAPWLPAVLLAALALQALRSVESNRRWLAFTYNQTEDQRKLFYLTDLLTGRDEQKEMRVFGLRGHLGRRWQEMRRWLRVEMLREKARLLVFDLPPAAVGWLVPSATALLLAGRLSHHGLNAGAFVALFGGLSALESAVSSFLSSVVEMHTDTTGVGYVRDLIDLPVPAEPPPVNEGGAPFPAPLCEDLRCEGVMFAYPGGAAPVIQGLNLVLHAGEHVALVGENGSGKSTLANCLLGLYRPQVGRILADGVDYATIAPESLRANVTAAFQDFAEFAFTAGESIGLGRVEAVTEEGVVRAAASLGGADEFVRALPQGYQTPIGHVLDGASDLSGGQWQRIAISRAFMRDAQFLVLDEPAASLDPKAEAELYARFGALLGGRTALLISHRLGSARLADRILVMKSGRIIEDGRHEELLQLGGEYARMWEEQAQWYR